MVILDSRDATIGYLNAKAKDGNYQTRAEINATIAMMEALIDEVEMLLTGSDLDEVEGIYSEDFGHLAYYSINDPETWLGFAVNGPVHILCESYELMAEMAAEGRDVL